MNWLHYTLAAAIVFVCMLLVVIILLQKGRGGGLSGVTAPSTSLRTRSIKPRRSVIGSVTISQYI